MLKLAIAKYLQLFMLKLASIINQALTISLIFYISGKKTQQNKRTLAIAEVSNIRDEIFIMLKLAITMKEHIYKKR